MIKLEGKKKHGSLEIALLQKPLLLSMWFVPPQKYDTYLGDEKVQKIIQSYTINRDPTLECGNIIYRDR